MTEPPDEPDPNRPQDRPQDRPGDATRALPSSEPTQSFAAEPTQSLPSEPTRSFAAEPTQPFPFEPTRSFPTYGRPEQPHDQQAGSTTPGMQAGTQWAAPGQPQESYGQSPHGQSAYGPQAYGPESYGQPQSSPGQPPVAPYGQSQQSPYGQPQQTAYGQQPPYGQAPYGHAAGAGYGPGQYPAAYGQPPAPYGYGYGNGYGYSGSGGGTNGLAAASLATGLGGILIGLAAPVAVCLGIAALVQINKRQQSGKGMAIAGVVIGSLVTVGYVILFGFVIAFGASADDDEYGAPEPVSSRSGPSTYVDDLIVGECFDDGSGEDEVIRQPCNEAHDGEIVGIVTLPDGSYPGSKTIDKAAESGCTPEFGKYVGKPSDKSELDLTWWTPSKSLWNHGDHRALCAAYGPDDNKLTTTIKNSHR